MQYWPLSALVESPLMPAVFCAELREAYRSKAGLSEGAFIACGTVAIHTAYHDAPNLVLIESACAPARRVYSGYPNHDEWLRLERGGVIGRADGMLCVLIDALH